MINGDPLDTIATIGLMTDNETSALQETGRSIIPSFKVP
jgi:hypothetical protein